MTAVVVVAAIRPLPEHRAEVIADVHAHDDGCLLYALHERDDPQVMIEKWASAAALAGHSRGAALAELNQALTGRLEGALDVQILQPHPAGTRPRAPCSSSRPRTHPRRDVGPGARPAQVLAVSPALSLIASSTRRWSAPMTP